MSILGRSENLEILKLKEYAFKGDLWKMKQECFSVFKVLYIVKTGLIQWEASAHHFFQEWVRVHKIIQNFIQLLRFYHNRLDLALQYFKSLLFQKWNHCIHRSLMNIYVNDIFRLVNQIPDLFHKFYFNGTHAAFFLYNH